MRALVLRQPWASLVALGVKRIEIRSWTTRHRGDLLIVSGKRADVEALEHAASFMDGDTSSTSTDWPRGVAVCLAQLVDVRPLTPRDAFAAACSLTDQDCRAQWAWVLGHVRALRPFAVRGQLGLFEVEDARISLVGRRPRPKVPSHVR